MPKIQGYNLRLGTAIVPYFHVKPSPHAKHGQAQIHTLKRKKKRW